MQNWYPGDEYGKGGIFNFVTTRGLCEGARSKISWTQVETGSAITWKYPSCILKGDDSIGAFYSVALSNHRQQADTGTKMIHLGKNTKSTIISKGISAGHGQQTYRGAVKIMRGAENARSVILCSSATSAARTRFRTSTFEMARPSSSTRQRHRVSEKISSSIADSEVFPKKTR